MRTARILLPGLALSALLTSGALAVDEVKPSGADPSEQSVATTEPASTASDLDTPQAAREAETAGAGERPAEPPAEAGDEAAAVEQDATPASEQASVDQAEPAPEQEAAEEQQASPSADSATAAAEEDSGKEPATAEIAPEQPATEQASTETVPSASEAAGSPNAGTPAEADTTANAVAEPIEPQSESEPSAAPVVVEYKYLPELLKQIAETHNLTDDDRAALSAFYEGRGDDLLWVKDGAFSTRAEKAIAFIRQADDWGLEASAFELPDAPASSDPADVASVELRMSLAALKYAKHARGGRMDPRQLSNYIDREAPLLPPAEVLAGLATADAAEDYLRGLHPRHPQFEKLRQAYLALKNRTTPLEDTEEPVAPKGKTKKAQKPVSAEARMRKLLHNMEQWRWMPEDLGQFYVWANVPEFTLRVMRDGEAIFTERLIVGKADTQTPIFSDEMETIVFHPFWGVPDSIKVKEILPGLVRGSSVLERNDLRIQYRGRDINPASVDWSRTDIRNFHVYQPPGGRNVLGVVKFLFPNKHAVYMHDTPTKNLFQASKRTFSHGCMRVRNPLEFASVLLAKDKGWNDSKVKATVKNGPSNNHVNLDTKIPVHITYFTAWVEDDGKVKTWPDIYGHEQRIQMGLEGKAHLIAKRKEDLGTVQAEVVGRLAETKQTWSGQSSSQPDWVRRVFGN